MIYSHLLRQLITCDVIRYEKENKKKLKMGIMI